MSTVKSKQKSVFYSVKLAAKRTRWSANSQCSLNHVGRFQQHWEPSTEKAKGNSGQTCLHTHALISVCVTQSGDAWLMQPSSSCLFCVVMCALMWLFFHDHSACRTHPSGVKQKELHVRLTSEHNCNWRHSLMCFPIAFCASGVEVC